MAPRRGARSGTRYRCKKDGLLDGAEVWLWRGALSFKYEEAVMVLGFLDGDVGVEEFREMLTRQRPTIEAKMKGKPKWETRRRGGPLFSKNKKGYYYGDGLKGVEIGRDMKAVRRRALEERGSGPVLMVWEPRREPEPPSVFMTEEEFRDEMIRRVCG